MEHGSSSTPAEPLTAAQREVHSRVKPLSAAGRLFASLSVHPNNKELLFLETKEREPEVSMLLRYDIETEKMQFYDLPRDYRYLSAAFSPSGKYVLLWRAPVVHGTRHAIRAAAADSEIEIMQSDGSGRSVLALREGLKMLPVMSHDERYVAFWRGEISKRRKSFSRHNEVWEFDLLTRTEKLFAKSYEWSSAGPLNYLQDNQQIIVYGGYPRQPAPKVAHLPTEYVRSVALRPPTENSELKINGPALFAVRRGTNDYPRNQLVNVPEPSNPSLDRAQNLYVVSRPPGETIFYVQGPENAIRDLEYPAAKNGAIFGAVAFPNASHIAVIFIYPDTPLPNRGLALFNLEKKTWRQLDIPSWEDATKITSHSAR